MLISMGIWIERWGATICKTQIPGVWRLKEGGCLVRARATEGATGREIEIRRRLPDLDEAHALLWLEQERKRIRAGLTTSQQPKPRFAVYATSLLETKIALREIKSAKGREKWATSLAHLIAGTSALKPEKRGEPSPASPDDVAGFGEMFLDRIESSHFERWRLGIAKLIARGRYKPGTTNTWLAILKVVMKAARREFKLPEDPADGVRFFDTSEHRTFTEEEPNSLTVDEACAFLSCLFDQYPHHYAMIVLGFVTGLRPSSLRPLRRSGPTPDIQWAQGKLLVRRSHTLGQEIMNLTKTKLDQVISVPEDLLDVLRWHVETQLVTDEQRESELLFPREDGLLRTDSSLKKCFPAVAKLVGLTKRVTSKAMRRTFNDVARGAEVKGIVIKKISGHLTDRMVERYSTVSAGEQRTAVGDVLRLVRPRLRSGDTGGDKAPASGDKSSKLLN